MNEEIRKVKAQIKSTKLERNQLIQKYEAGELSEYPFKQTRTLNSQIWKLIHRLDNLLLRNPVKYDVESLAKPNPVELIATWYDLFVFMVLMTWLCGGVSVCLRGEEIGFAIFGVGFVILAIGMPGLLIGKILDAVKNRFGEIMPTYYCSESLLTGGINLTLRRCWGNLTSDMALVAILVLWIIAGNLACIFIPGALAMSVSGLVALSIGGFFTIGAKITLDVRKGTRMARQVF